jgi:hypothetical protein
VYREGEDEPFAENDDRGDGTLFSTIEGLEVEPGDVLIIEAGTFADEGGGAYSLRVSPPAPVEDAGEIAVGDSVEGTFAENTRQRYTLTVEDSAALQIALEVTIWTPSYAYTAKETRRRRCRTTTSSRTVCQQASRVSSCQRGRRW